MRTNKQVVKLIETNEETKERSLSNCSKCIYREKDMGHCWYVMTTNKQNYVKDGYCNHFADREYILNCIREMQLIKNLDNK